MKLNNFSLIGILENLSRKNVLFGKSAVRQYAKLPIIFDKSHINIFKYLNPTTDKVIVKTYGIDDKSNKNELFDKIKEIFNVKIIKDYSSYIICSTLISSFLTTFYRYEASWNPLSKEEILNLREKWSIFQT